jgi:hypothetical protein
MSGKYQSRIPQQGPAGDEIDTSYDEIITTFYSYLQSSTPTHYSQTKIFTIGSSNLTRVWVNFIIG